MLPSYLDVALRLVERARAAGADEADVSVGAGNTLSVTVRKGDVEKLVEATSKGLSLRVFRDGRSAIVSTSDFSSDSLDSLVSDALDLSSIGDPDPAAGLPDAMLSDGVVTAETLGLFDPVVPNLVPALLINTARRAEAAAYGYDPRVTNSDGGSASRWFGRRTLVMSNGFQGSYTGTTCSVGASAMCDDAENKKRNDGWSSTRRRFDLLDQPEEVGRKAAERAVRRLGARKVTTRRVPVVWESTVARSFLALLAGAANGSRMYRSSSFLVGHEGAAIASPLLTVIDDPTIPGLPASRPFDGEGLPSRRNMLFERGAFVGFLFDTYSARKSQRSSTHSASRSGGVGVGTTNLWLERGQMSVEQVIAGVPDGLYLTDLLGHGDNLVTGDFSRGCGGIWIEHGQLTYPVAEINVSGQLRDMLLDIDAVAGDLEFRGAISSPTFRMAELTVSGT